jgi:hypothetical protein
MTTNQALTAPVAVSTGTAGRMRTQVVAALGIAASSVLTAIGTFGWFEDNATPADHRASDWLTVLPYVAVTAAVVFGLVVRTAEAGNPGRRSAILGVFGFLSNAVFWAGLPAVIAAGSIACALTQKDRDGSFSGASKAGLGLSGITVAAAIWLAIVG